MPGAAASPEGPQAGVGCDRWGRIHSVVDRLLRRVLVDHRTDPRLAGHADPRRDREGGAIQAAAGDPPLDRNGPGRTAPVRRLCPDPIRRQTPRVPGPLRGHAGRRGAAAVRRRRATSKQTGGISELATASGFVVVASLNRRGGAALLASLPLGVCRDGPVSALRSSIPSRTAQLSAGSVLLTLRCRPRVLRGDGPRGASARVRVGGV